MERCREHRTDMREALAQPATRESTGSLRAEGRGPSPTRHRRLSGPRHHEALVRRLAVDHGQLLLSVARRYSFCFDDANEAWQRSLEILLRRASTLEDETALAWMRTVVKHEALAVRTERSRTIGGDDELENLADPVADPEIEVQRKERLAIAAEALGHLKPGEADALLLKAQGLSYDEIASERGWTYTKVNRLLTEGRRSFRERVGSIEAGVECERVSALIPKLASGGGSLRDRRAMIAHARRCRDCRQLAHRSGLRPEGLLVLPPSLVVGWQWLSDRTLGGLLRSQTLIEAASAGKVAAVAASAVAIAGGGVAVERGIDLRPALKAPAASTGVSTAVARFTGSPQPESAPERRVPLEREAPAKPAAIEGTTASSNGSSRTEFDPLAAAGSGDPRPVAEGAPAPRASTFAATQGRAARPSATAAAPNLEFGP